MNRLMKMAGFMPVILGTLCACQSASTERYDIANKEDLYKNLPFEMPVVQHPSFPDYQVDIRDFGAKADGETLNTEAINNAIRAVSEKGGGKVIIPEGLWLTGLLYCRAMSTCMPNEMRLYSSAMMPLCIRWYIPLSRGWTCSVASRLSLR